MCDNFTSRDCGVPDPDRFEAVFNQLDANGDQLLTRTELVAGAGALPIRDANAFGLGSIPVAFGLIIQIFGENPDVFIWKPTMRSVFVDREFPANFVPRTSLAQKTKRQEQTKFINPALENFKLIICPFLSTLVHEEVLPIKTVYNKELLMEVIMQAGLSEDAAEEHIEDNFAFNPSGSQDIFNMEGAANEHKTSTGINDCSTAFGSCEQSGGQLLCSNFTSRTECAVPDGSKFDSVFDQLDTNSDGNLDRSELFANADLLPIGDANAFGVGSIPGSFGLIMQVFGETIDRISKDRLRTVFIDRKFPAGFFIPLA